MRVNPYLNFAGTTEEAFTFYKSIFGGEFTMVQRFKDVADLPNKAQMSEADLNKIMHIALPIGANTLMATDTLTSMGQTLTVGNNLSLSLHPDTKEEADRLYGALSASGKAEMPMTDMFWGDYWGLLTDKFGIQWMINVAGNK